MFIPDPSVAKVAQVIELAVAPVFLLTGVGATLGVISNRLARVVDRARQLEGELPEPHVTGSTHRADITTLSRRARLLSRAIALLVVCALLVGCVIVGLFLGVFFDVPIGSALAAAFICAMLAFVGALGTYLREVLLGTRSLRLG